MKCCVLLLALAVTVAAQSEADIPREAKVNVAISLLRRAEKTLGTICKFATQGSNPEPVHCTCKDQKQLTIAQMQLDQLDQFQPAWNLWKCLPEFCTCTNNEEPRVPLPARLRTTVTPEAEQMEILKEAQAKLAELQG